MPLAEFCMKAYIPFSCKVTWRKVMTLIVPYHPEEAVEAVTSISILSWKYWHSFRALEHSYNNKTLAVLVSHRAVINSDDSFLLLNIMDQCVWRYQNPECSASATYFKIKVPFANVPGSMIDFKYGSCWNMNKLSDEIICQLRFLPGTIIGKNVEGAQLV